jgi:DNA (cytosine-5)-methyltransferase 1
MRVYYNEWDKFAAQWLRNLIAAGHLPEGDVDERDIREVRPSDLVAYGQCHFFAGIGGWPLALKLAGWPDDAEAWTGSCPCQPLSGAGQRRGHADERHLWPAFHRLIAERKPSVVFGEQVAAKDGREWLAGVRADLEALGYAVGAADLCAASVGAPHIRQRLWCVADAMWAGRAERWSGAGNGSVAGSGSLSALADAGSTGLAQRGSVGRAQDETHGASARQGPVSGGNASFWGAFDLIPCTDGKARRVEPGTFPLVAGLSKGMVRGGDPSEPFDANNSAEGRVGRLRGYGNSINVYVAKAFVEAAYGAIQEVRQAAQP